MSNGEITGKGGRCRCRAAWMVLMSMITLAGELHAAVVAPVKPPRPAQPPGWASACGQDNYGVWADLTIGHVTQRLRLIAPGRFTMGSPDSEEGSGDVDTLHPVALTSGFWLGDTEVTQLLWKAVTGANPSKFTGDGSLPVEHVSWNDCAGFFAKLNAMKPGLAAQFPSEAQWEYACRCGTTGPWPGDPGALAWYAANNTNTTHPVKTKAANAWGLFDMQGNVWEFCLDWSAPYAAGAQADPSGPRSGNAKIARGGSFQDAPEWCRAAHRQPFPPAFNGDMPSVTVALGLRICVPLSAANRDR